MHEMKIMQSPVTLVHLPNVFILVFPKITTVDNIFLVGRRRGGGAGFPVVFLFLLISTQCTQKSTQSNKLKCRNSFWFMLPVPPPAVLDKVPKHVLSADCSCLHALLPPLLSWQDRRAFWETVWNCIWYSGIPWHDMAGAHPNDSSSQEMVVNIDTFSPDSSFFSKSYTQA